VGKLLAVTLGYPGFRVSGFGFLKVLRLERGWGATGAEGPNALSSTLSPLLSPLLFQISKLLEN
jgi:hypothetical protein